MYAACMRRPISFAASALLAAAGVAAGLAVSAPVHLQRPPSQLPALLRDINPGGPERGPLTPVPNR
jgi:hypothetical protein